MAGELGIIFQIIQSTIKIEADACIGAEDIAFSVQFHRYAVGVHVVTFACIQRNHQAVAGIHAVALHQPGDVGGIEEGRNVIFYLSGFYGGVQLQRFVVKEGVDGDAYILFHPCLLSGIGVEAFQHGGEVVFLLLLTIMLRILYQAGDGGGVQITRVGVTEAT